mmetsp:Transcript_11828/g.18565  ORF Transcript_11828/g.18565 Transcript_11828/m.18565 type:complete len:286 (-) Transcript_11828:138-995(-)|eukprot:CAMPEP_0184294756 /NCGR_PEP_ID=MMETSP1049-20130417/5864_1 /TAXON_ID=77928 /ORGANISM="Proteomonas sulcata, Strain CCMP704" /LENGTH=285 /DNA_ID=CAMNT_0026603145 /DNA_START=39 /DNA_END=896 /DNA_ORIENTATION=-
MPKGTRQAASHMIHFVQSQPQDPYSEYTGRRATCKHCNEERQWDVCSCKKHLALICPNFRKEHPQEWAQCVLTLAPSVTPKNAQMERRKAEAQAILGTDGAAANAEAAGGIKNGAAGAEGEAAGEGGIKVVTAVPAVSAVGRRSFGGKSGNITTPNQIATFDFLHLCLAHIKEQLQKVSSSGSAEDKKKTLAFFKQYEAAIPKIKAAVDVKDKLGWNLVVRILSQKNRKPEDHDARKFLREIREMLEGSPHVWEAIDDNDLFEQLELETWGAPAAAAKEGVSAVE